MTTRLKDTPTGHAAQALSTHGFLLGKVSGWQDAGARLIKQSGELFADGKDERAQLMREIGRQLIKEAESQRKVYDERKPEREAAWAVIAAAGRPEGAEE